MDIEGKKILLMGSSNFKADELPPIIRARLDSAIEKGVIFLVAEARGACRLFQDYLASKKYAKVIVGHGLSMRYNAGRWITISYGDDLKERERNMIEECDYAIVIWQDSSGTIAENLQYLKKLGKPTFLYEYDSSDETEYAGELDPQRSFRPFYPYSK